MADIESILKNLPRVRQAAEDLRDILLGNLVMIGEIPSPTGEERARVELLLERFAGNGLQNCSVDDKGSGFGVFFGREGKRNILLVSTADTLVTDVVDQTVEIEKDRVVGPFVGDNSIALAAMCSIPAVLERLGVELESNIVFMAAARMLGRGNLEGLRFFLEHSSMHIHSGLCLESVQLGRLNYTGLGMLRGEIVCRLPRDYNWVQYGATGSIVPMNDVISGINKIPVPQRPLTRIVLGSITGGIAHHNIARQTTLRFEVRSESGELLNTIHRQVQDVVDEVAAQSGVEVTLDVFARREPGGLHISHPLVQNARAILGALGLQPMVYPTTTALSAFADRQIPGLTLGVTTGERKNELDEIDEYVAIPPMFTGLAQIIGVLQAIDGGLCDEP